MEGIEGRKVDVEPTVRSVRVADELDRVALVLDSMAASIGRITDSSTPMGDDEAQGWCIGLADVAGRVRKLSGDVMRLRDPEELAAR